MTRHDDGDRVRAIGHADRPHRFWILDALREIQVGDRFAVRFLRLKVALRQQELQEVGVVRDFVLTAEIGVFVLERVEAVRARRSPAGGTPCRGR